MHFTPLVCLEQFFNQEYLSNKLLVPFDVTFNVLLNLKLVVQCFFHIITLAFQYRIREE